MMIQDKKQQKRLLYTILVAGCMSTMNTSTVNIALPVFMELFGTSLSTAQWLMVGYMLALGIAMPMAGYLGERYSYRRLYLAALAMAAVFSAGCALAWNIWSLIAFRFCKGMAAGLLLPCTMTLLYRYLPKDKQAGYLGVSLAFSSLGVAVGPAISGFILTFFNWHSLFLVNLPLLLAAWVLAWGSIPAEDGVQCRRFPAGSIALLTAGTALVLASFTRVNTWGWASPAFWLLLAAGIVCMAWFVRIEWASREPVLNFTVLRYRSFAIALTLIAAIYLVVTITPLLMALYLQTLQGYTAFQAGLILLIPSFMMIAGNSAARAMLLRTGHRRLVLYGLLLAALGNFAMGFVQLDTAVWLVVVALSVRYFGVGMLNMPLADYGMRDLPPALAGHGSALLNWIRQISSVIWLSILTAVLTIATAQYAAQGMAEAAASLAGIHTVFFVLTAGLLLIWLITRRIFDE